MSERGRSLGRSLRRAGRRVTNALLIVGVLLAAFSLPITSGSTAKPPPQMFPPPSNAAELSTSIEAWQQATPAERAAFVAWVAKTGLDTQRARVTSMLRARGEARANRAGSILGTIFLLLALASLLLVFLPLFVSKARAPRRGALWFHAALGAAVLALTFLLLSGGLEILASVSNTVAQAANPEQGLVDAAFDRLETLAQSGEAANDALPFGPTLGAGEDESASFLSNLWTNLQYFDPKAFEPAVVWSQRAWTVLGLLPHVIPFLIALVFLLTMRPTLGRMLRMPLQAARGERRSGLRAIREAATFVGREWLAIVALGLILLPLSLFMQVGSRHMSHSLVRLALAQSRTTVEYFGRLTEAPSQPALTLGILALPAFLVIATLLTATALGLFAFWARRLTQLRFHEGIPLRAHGRHWRRSLLAVLQMQWIPVLWLGLAAGPLAEMQERPIASAGEALGRMTQTGWLLGLGLVVAFVAFGGLRGVRYLVTFRPRREGGRRLEHALREATPEDQAFLQRVHHEGLRPWIEAVWGWDRAEQDALTEAWLARHEPQIITVGGRDAGLLLVAEEDVAVKLQSVILRPRYRRRGLGTRIVKDVIARAEARGVPTLLRVLKPNPARHLYERLGFVVTGETETHYAMRREPERQGEATPEV